MQIALTERVALITGGSRGIGRAIAERLASAGARVMINYRGNAQAAEETVAAIRAAGGIAHMRQADVAESSQADALVKETIAIFGRLDLLVNNAGITRDTLLLRMKDEDFDSVIATNLRGVFACTRAAVRHLSKAPAGRLINISSVVGQTGNPGQANYAAAKAGIIGFTRAVAREYAARGLTANVIAPGFIETEMTDELNDAARNAALANIPLGHFGKPSDVASLACFLASDAAAYITGQVLNVDGGMVMR